MAAHICLKPDVGTNSFAFDIIRIIRETLSNKWTPAVFASRMLIGLNLTSCQIEISRMALDRQERRFTIPSLTSLINYI